MVFLRAGRRRGRRALTLRRILALALLAVLLAAGLPAQGSQLSWARLAEEEASLRDSATHGNHGIAVGDGGLVLHSTGGDWHEVDVPTTRDLRGVAMRHEQHAAAVGTGGIVVEMRHRFSDVDAPPAGTLSAAGQLGGTRAQWQVPLAALDTASGAPLGIRATAARGSSASHHPIDSDGDAPETAAAVQLSQIPTGSPPINGQPHPTWANGLTFSHPTQSVPFTLYLLRDTTFLYAMISSTALSGPDRLTFQVAAQHGPDLRPGDVRLSREGSGLAVEGSAVVGAAATWEVALAANTLPGVGALHAAAFTSDGALLAAGAGGKVIVRNAGTWTTYTASGSPTFRAADTQGNHVYLAGGNAQGTGGGTIHRFTGSALQLVTIPLGSPALWDIDMAACRAVGNAGAVLRCLNGNPAQWVDITLQDGPTLHGVAWDGATNRAWAAGALDGAGALYFLNAGGHWIPQAIPAGTAPISSLTFALGGPLLTTLAGELLVLRAHPPAFVDLPDTLRADSGSPLSHLVQVTDPDGDIVDLEVDPPTGLPEVSIERLERDLFRIVWVPDFGVHGPHLFRFKLFDGKFEVGENVTVIVDPVNGPPVWDPHPNVVIPHSLAWTASVSASDPDGDPLTLSAPLLPAGATFNDLGGGDGALAWTPGPLQLGTHPVSLEADDGALTATLGFTITVVDRRPPIIDFVTPTNPRVCVAGPWWPGTITFTAGAHDPDGDPVTFAWTFSDTGEIKHGSQVTHTYTTVGFSTVTLTVTDSVGLTATRVLNVKAADCVRVEVQMDDPCSRIIDKATGVVHMWNHTGFGANGTFEVQVWWRSYTGTQQFTTVTGSITNGEGHFQVPYDLSPLPLNEPVNHTVHASGVHASLLGGTESSSGTTHYRVEPDCKHVPWPF